MRDNDRQSALAQTGQHGGGTLTARRPPKGTVVVTTMASDSHTWNLVYLQAVIEELGYEVVNLGPCVPDDLLVERCQEILPSMVVISSVNGHGYQDGLRVIERFRDCPQLLATPVVIGGKLGIAAGVDADRLVAAGFDAVFQDGEDSMAQFRRFLGSTPAEAPMSPGHVGIGV